MISVLDFVNRVRALTGASPLPGLPLLGTEPDDEERDVLRSALGVSVGASEHSDWSTQGRWVMRFHDASNAERVASALGQEWLDEPPEVALPDALVDLAVSEHFAVVVEDDEGWLRGWWAPGDDGHPEFFTPSDPLVPTGGGTTSNQ